MLRRAARRYDAVRFRYKSALQSVVCDRFVYLNRTPFKARSRVHRERLEPLLLDSVASSVISLDETGTTFAAQSASVPASSGHAAR